MRVQIPLPPLNRLACTEQLVVEFYGQPVTEIKQQFKVIGDVWEVDCSRLPQQFDRRTLISCMLLMGMIERDRK